MRKRVRFKIKDSVHFCCHPHAGVRIEIPELPILAEFPEATPPRGGEN